MNLLNVFVSAFQISYRGSVRFLEFSRSFQWVFQSIVGTPKSKQILSYNRTTGWKVSQLIVVGHVVEQYVVIYLTTVILWPVLQVILKEFSDNWISEGGESPQQWPTLWSAVILFSSSKFTARRLCLPYFLLDYVWVCHLLLLRRCRCVQCEWACQCCPRRGHGHHPHLLTNAQKQHSRSRYNRRNWWGRLYILLFSEM